MVHLEKILKYLCFLPFPMQVEFSPLIYPLRTYVLRHCFALSSCTPFLNIMQIISPKNLTSEAPIRRLQRWGNDKGSVPTDYMPTTALPVGIKAHTYMHSLMQYCSNLCTPHVCQQMGLAILPAGNHWTNTESQVRLMAKAPGGCLEDARSNYSFQRLPVLLQLWWRTHGEASYHRYLIPPQLCRKKE